MNEKKSLECPFNWDIDEKLTSQYDEDDELEVNVNVQPVMSLMKSVMISYAKIVQQNYKFAQDNLKKTDQIWNEIINYKKREIKDDKISLDVLLHIKEATKFFVLEKINSPKATKILDTIINANVFKSRIEFATIEGCKSIIWLNFHEKAFQKAMLHAKLAYTNNPDCALWNHALAKTLRSKRRHETFSNEVSNEEKSLFLKSYELSRIPFYAIKVAGMYREIKEFDKAKELLEQIFNENPSDEGILLTLVKSFISYKDFSKAKSCLDLIENSIPNNSAFLHYKGMYFEKQGDYKEAVRYLEQAIENTTNYMAEMTYVRCMIKLYQRKFDYEGHLKKMVDKYDKSCYKQKVLLDLAMLYYFKKKDIFNAGLYLSQSIQLNPENKLFKNYYSFDKKKCINIFKFISNELIPKLEQNKCSRNAESILKTLKDMFNETDESNNLLSKAVKEMKLN